MSTVVLDMSGLDITLEKLISNDALLKKSVESYGILEQEIVLSTRNKLNKHGRAGTGGESLMQSWNGVLVKKPKDAQVSFGVSTDKPYADIHNRGGVIGPGPKMLAIPLTEFARGRWPRDWTAGGLAYVKVGENSFLVKTERKAPRSKKHRSKRSRPQKWKASKPRKRTNMDDKPFEAQYLLRDAVKIKATNYYKLALKAAMPHILNVFKRVR